jgi:uncharacterized membrane protein YeaQ/YmgE (transglycosylase-associated protein family)
MEGLIMNEERKQYIADIVGSILAGALITTALINLIPEGMWLYLIYLVMGTAMISSKLNRILRG